MASNGSVAVWEWQNEYGKWTPYDPGVSTFIESNINSSTPLQLGSVDPRLYQYVIDLQRMCQIRQGTGTQRSIKRAVYPASNPLAKGIAWMWEGDIPGRWNNYDSDVTDFLESCHSNGQSVIDMSVSKFRLPYHIDLQNMTQIRKETGRVRKIKRDFTKGIYSTLANSVVNSVSSNKRQASSISYIAGNKKQRTVAATGGSSTLPQPSLMSNLPSSSSTFSSVPASQTTILNNPFASVSNTATPFSSNLSVGGRPGPLTRQRYNQAISANTLTNHGTSAFQPVQPVVSSQPQTGLFSSVPSSWPGHYPSFNSAVTPVGGLSSLFNGLSSPAMGGLIGGNIQSGPYGMGVSQSYAGVPMGSTGFHHSQSSTFVPQAFLSGSKSSRIRPSQRQHGASNEPSIQIPSHEIIPNMVEKSSKRGSKQTTAGNHADTCTIIDNYATELGAPPTNEDCCICYEKLIEASGHGSGTGEDHTTIQLEKCSHMFHKLCLKAMYESGSKTGSFQCPSCKTIYGEKLGNCPRGEMEYRIISDELEGHKGSKTIQILYHIHSGIQGPEHPHPGKRYTTRGFPRIGFLPDCDRGRKVLQLLIVAWKRRLTFTIGTSTTTGEENTVTWNEIHHKTELRGNYSGHGYPDPNYLDNVLLELATHGITEKDLPS